MNGGELKLGGGQNPTQTMNFNVLSNNTTARVTAVTAGANLAMEGRVTFNVADGSQDVDLLVLPNLLERNGGAGKGQIMKTGAGTMRMTGTNTHEVGTWVRLVAVSRDGNGHEQSGVLSEWRQRYGGCGECIRESDFQQHFRLSRGQWCKAHQGGCGATDFGECESEQRCGCTGGDAAAGLERRKRECGWKHLRLQRGDIEILHRRGRLDSLGQHRFGIGRLGL
ncbi:MAG: hypothetical protein EBV49_14330 [Betaproteobacteria bacterium]|nr:hypothetical protein [Betaproteobacteria bacterium]